MHPRNRSVWLIVLYAGCMTVQAQREQPREPPSPGSAVTTPATVDALKPNPQVLAKPAALSDFEKRFLMAAAHANAAELEASRLLLQGSQTVELKDYAQMLIREHREAQGQLKQLAASKRVNLPQGPSPDDEKALTQLRSLEGDALDREYLQRFGVQSHRQSIALHERAANQARDPDVKTFATSQLSVLRRHLEHAERLAQPGNRQVPPAISQSAPALPR